MPDIRRSLSMTRISRVLTVAACLIALSVAGCASLPPAKTAATVTDIAGKWTGSGYGPGGAPVAVTQTINPDGSYTSILPNGTFTGKITLTDGRLRGVSDQTKNTGTYTLHEGEGRRVLRYQSDDGRIRSELTPAK